MSYPEHLHESHKDFPLCPEQLTIQKEMLSEDTRDFMDRHNIRFSPQKRLTQNFFDKKNYVVHVKALKFYMEQGIILDKVHRGIQFRQSPWMKPYIDHCTQKRINAESKFEKDFFKLLVSARIVFETQNMSNPS